MENRLEFAAFAELAQQQAGRMKWAIAGFTVEQALLAGRAVAFSDASFLINGDAAIAFGAFDSTGNFLGASACRVAAKNSTEAEALAARAALEFLNKSGEAGLVFTDCLPLLIKARGDGEMSGQLAWVPRDGIRPANAAARAALGLPEEKPKALPWEDHFQLLMRMAAEGPMPQKPSMETAQKIHEAQQRGDVICALSIEELPSKKSCAMSMAFFSSQGFFLKERFALRAYPTFDLDVHLPRLIQKQAAAIGGEKCLVLSSKTMLDGEADGVKFLAWDGLKMGLGAAPGGAVDQNDPRRHARLALREQLWQAWSLALTAQVRKRCEGADVLQPAMGGDVGGARAFGVK